MVMSKKVTMRNEKSMERIGGTMRRTGSRTGSVRRARKRMKEKRSSKPNQEAKTRTRMAIINRMMLIEMSSEGMPSRLISIALLLPGGYADRRESEGFAARDIRYMHASKIGQRGHIFLHQLAERARGHPTGNGGRGSRGNARARAA